MVSRPSIAYSVSVISLFMSSLTIAHWEALGQILCYLKGAPTHGLFYGNHGHSDIECFSVPTRQDQILIGGQQQDIVFLWEITCCHGKETNYSLLN